MMNLINILFSLLNGKLSFKLVKDIIPLVSKSVQTLIVALLPEALKIVSDLATKGELSNKQKQKEAFTQIQKIAKEKGLVVGASLINLVIELAVTSSKK